MSGLLEYIKDKVDNCDELSKDSRSKYRQCARSLQGYIGEGKDVDIMMQASEGWLDGYYDYLVTNYEGQKDKSIEPEKLEEAKRARAIDHFKTLRRVNFNAISDGLLPNIDFFIGLKSLAMERDKNIVVPNIVAEFGELFKSTKPKKLKDKCLLCVAFAGIPFDMLDSVLGSIKDGEVHLSHLGVTVSIPKNLQGKVEGYLSNQDKADKMPDLKGQGIKLFRSGNMFIDWLCALAQQPKSDYALIKRFMLLYLDPEHTDAKTLQDDIERAIQTISDNLLKSDKTINEGYYAVRTYGRSAAEFVKDLVEREDSPFKEMLSDHTWCPCTSYKPQTAIEKIVAKKGKCVDEQRTLLRNIFFVQASIRDIACLDRGVANIWVFQTRDGNKRLYTRIPEGQLGLLRRTLERITDVDDVEFEINVEPSVKTDYANEEPVEIDIDGFRDCKATIIKVIEDPEEKDKGRGANRLCKAKDSEKAGAAIGSEDSAQGSENTGAGIAVEDNEKVANNKTVSKNIKYRIKCCLPDGKTIILTLSPESLKPLL